MRQAKLELETSKFDGSISIWNSTKRVHHHATPEEIALVHKINNEYPELTVFSKAKLFNCYVSANVMSLYAGN